MITITLDRRDVGRLLNLVAKQRRSYERGIKKFDRGFDPEKGANLTDGLAAHQRIEDTLEKALCED
jgi:hypothetical protein